MITDLACLLKYLNPARLRGVRANYTSIVGSLSNPTANTITRMAGWTNNSTILVLGVNLSSAIAAPDAAEVTLATVSPGDVVRYPAASITQGQVLMAHVVLANVDTPVAAPYLTQNCKTQKLYFPTPIIVDAGQEISMWGRCTAANAEMTGFATIFWVVANDGVNYKQVG